MVERLTTKNYWEYVWKDIRLPAIAKPSSDLQEVLNSCLPRGSKLNLLEIGCAPGRWMAYFYKNFGYAVDGIEYADDAVEITRQNLQMQRVPGRVVNEDFFKFEADDVSYDVVFSGGFLEHFEELDFVVDKMSFLTTKYIITIVPNLCGLNGLISKIFRPKIYNAHKKIDSALLKKLHEQANIKTLFCNYTGGILFSMPAQKSDFFEKRKFFSWLINVPFRVLNVLCRKTINRFGLACRTRYFSPSVLYIGQKLQ